MIIDAYKEWSWHKQPNNAAIINAIYVGDWLQKDKITLWHPYIIAKQFYLDLIDYI